MIFASTGFQSLLSRSIGSTVKAEIPRIEIITETIRRFLGTLVNANAEPTIKEISAKSVDESSDIFSPS
jgi:hypothetical protein